MIDPKLIELMNRVLDGAATEPERADLDRALTASPEARAHYDDLSRLIGRLESVPMVDPPAHLHSQIMDAVDASEFRYTPRASSEERGFFSWLRAMGTRRGLGYASTFGLGLAAGAIVLAVIRPIPVDPGQVAGSLTTARQLEGVLPVDVPHAGVNGSVKVVDLGDLTQVRLQVDGESGTEWVFDIPRAEPTPPVVLKVIQAGDTVFEGTVKPVEP